MGLTQFLELLEVASDVFGGWGDRSEWEWNEARQAELERKIAIADAGIAARGRGEAFVPPADYAR